MEGQLVSVIVRTKDRPALLRDAIKSIASQTYRHVEAIVVNDGGCKLDTDELQSLLGDIPLNYISLHKNAGRAGAGNAGIEKAQGQYVMFLDDDDLIYPNCIKSLLSASGDVAYGKCHCVKHSGDKVERLFTFDKPFDMNELFFRNFIPINSVLMKKKNLEDAGLFDAAFEILEDWDMLFRLALSGHFVFVDEVVSEYRVFDTATIMLKGGAEYHNRYRNVFYAKHSGYLSVSVIDSYLDKRLREESNALHSRVKALEDEMSLIKNSKAWKAVTTYRKLKGLLKH